MCPRFTTKIRVHQSPPASNQKCPWPTAIYVGPEIAPTDHNVLQAKAPTCRPKSPPNQNSPITTLFKPKLPRAHRHLRQARTPICRPQTTASQKCPSANRNPLQAIILPCRPQSASNQNWPELQPVDLHLLQTKTRPPQSSSSRPQLPPPTREVSCSLRVTSVCTL